MEKILTYKHVYYIVLSRQASRCCPGSRAIPQSLAIMPDWEKLDNMPGYYVLVVRHTNCTSWFQNRQNHALLRRR
jgi:hypothetical protein